MREKTKVKKSTGGWFSFYYEKVFLYRCVNRTRESQVVKLMFVLYLMYRFTIKNVSRRGC